MGRQVPIDIPPELARRIERTRARRTLEYARAMARLHPDWPVATWELGGGLLAFVHPSSPVNGCRGLGLDRPVSTRDLSQVEDFFERRGSPARIDVCPLLDASLPGRLLDHGYERHDALAVLYLHLRQLPQLPPRPEGVVVGPARDSQADLWISTTASGFDSCEEPDQSTLMMLAGNYYASNSTPYLACFQDSAAGGGAMFTGVDAAELGGDSTKPAFRNRGVHSALIAARLSDAFRLGIDLLIYCSEPGSASQSHAERFGFRLAYLSERFVKQ